jgi:SAM-dependent methyltransferase
MPEKMMQTHFPHIIYSDHFDPLKECFDLIPNDVNSLLDLGCGKAQISDAFPEYEYCGADLPHIIQKVSKISKPSLEYVEFDATICNMDFVSSFDVIVMNGFLSEIEKADEILCKVLKYAPKYVVIHRQEIRDKEDREEYLTYGGLKTTKYTFGKDRFEGILKEHSFTKMFETECLGNMKSLILRRSV